MKKTLSYVSEYLVGTATVEHYDNHSDQVIITSRKLLHKDEIRRLPSGSGLVIVNNEFPEKFKLRPLYKSWYYKWKYKLKNIGGMLKSIYPKVEHTAATDTIEYIPFQTSTKPQKINKESIDLEFQALIKKHFSS